MSLHGMAEQRLLLPYRWGVAHSGNMRRYLYEHERQRGAQDGPLHMS